MAPNFVWADEAKLKKSESEVAAVLTHLTKLLRLKNRLRSALLQLPTEIIVRILSFVMEDVENIRVWWPILRTCHRIYRIMSTATELWWKVDCTEPRASRAAITRSKGNPEVIFAPLNWDETARAVMEYWREKAEFHGHRLHTLTLYGVPSDVTDFSWIFERPLPRLRHLTIHLSGPPDDEGGEWSLPDSELALLPITLQLPMDMPLRTLSLRNATLPWSSSLFTGLRELRLNFGDCNSPMVIAEDELFGLLGASPQLESLLLKQVGPRTPLLTNVRQFAHEEAVRLPSLTSLWLENSPEVVGYMLARIGTPVVTSLHIRSRVSPQDVARSLNLLVPNDPPQKRLLSNPPVFGIDIPTYTTSDIIPVNIGSLKMVFDFDLDDAENISNAIVAHLQTLVPPSLTTLKIDYSRFGLDELRWREFFITHPDVRSIECSGSSRESGSEPLWDALSPTGTEAPPCPKLESISLFIHTASRHLLDCLLKRKNAGFELEYLKATDVVDGLAGEFSHLVKTFERGRPKQKIARRVRSIQRINFTCADLLPEEWI